MAQIFISYKRADKDKVFPLVARIEKELGCKCWVDLDGIESSAQFASVLCRAINNAEVVLFMHSLIHLTIDFDTDWTIKELNYAHEKKKRVVLVKLDDAPLDDIFLLEYGSKNNIDSRDPVQLVKLFNDLKSWLHITSVVASDSLKDDFLAEHPDVRQEPLCPCGSGKLFKECHGRTVVTQDHSDSVASKPVAQTSAERTWKVGDYYEVDGKKGVVFWVDKTGKHGKIVSLDQKKLRWCTNFEYIKKLTDIAVDKQDGMNNLKSIMKNSDWRNKYPAFVWCADHGDGWYFPAIEELKLLLLNDEVHDTVNAKIEIQGGEKLFSRRDVKWYWSSTEYNGWCAWVVSMYDGDSHTNLRLIGNGYVRAVSAF